MGSMFVQAAIAVQDDQTFGRVKAAIDDAFSPASVQGFLKSVERARLRIREFEGVLQAGLLGSASPAAYAKLGNSDQGQVRELYLASLEKVAPALRQKFLKLYAYY